MFAAPERGGGGSDRLHAASVCPLPTEQKFRRADTYGETLSGTEVDVASERIDCDRNVISHVRNLEEHRGLRRHTERSFRRVKSLIAYALRSVGVARYRWRASISKPCSFNHSDISPCLWNQSFAGEWMSPETRIVSEIVSDLLMCCDHLRRFGSGWQRQPLRS
jgi:hypothetical protein